MRFQPTRNILRAAFGDVAVYEATGIGFLIIPFMHVCVTTMESVNNCPTRCYYIQFTDSCTCFVWYPHPSSGAPSNCNYNIGTGRTVFATVRWREGVVPTPPRQRTVANTVRPVPDVAITVWGCSWWWMRVSYETCRAVCRNIIKLYIVASRWIIIDIDSRCTDPWHIKFNDG